ncbi:DUF922 domain-containing protein [Maribacter sp. 2308TA10-17]|uniref:DUF922 domain-containing protein n=1 Tax=Maribacter sp. 2308TA10-17 TaxID=3386276 RepID=UPI0039BCED54
MGITNYMLVFLVFGLMSFQPEQDYDTIPWNADRRLTWKDFNGKAPLNARAAATTASGITYRFSTSGTSNSIEVDFKIDTFFYPNKSWYQPELCDEVILSHEQLHFDISELYARKMRKRLAAATFTHKNVKAKVKAIYRNINEELSEFQNQYDSETNFSRDREQQAIWNEKIAKMLLN